MSRKINNLKTMLNFDFAIFGIVKQELIFQVGKFNDFIMLLVGDKWGGYYGRWARSSSMVRLKPDCLNISFASLILGLVLFLA